MHLELIACPSFPGEMRSLHLAPGGPPPAEEPLRRAICPVAPFQLFAHCQLRPSSTRPFVRLPCSTLKRSRSTLRSSPSTAFSSATAQPPQSRCRRAEAAGLNQDRREGAEPSRRPGLQSRPQVNTSGEAQVEERRVKLSPQSGNLRSGKN
jgi:hypothetical protein